MYSERQCAPPIILLIAIIIISCTASRAFGCSQQMIDHLRHEFDDVQATLLTALSIEETTSDKSVIGPFGGTQPQDLRQIYFGDTNREQDEHIRVTLNKMPEAIGAVTFSCIDDKHDPWGQRENCDTHVALSQHESNHVVLCPAFLRTALLRNISMIGATIGQVANGQQHLAAHVLIHELAHTSAASNTRRIVDWFLMAPLGGTRGHFAYEAFPGPSASLIAWYAMSTALALKGAVIDRLSGADCEAARWRYETLIEPERLLVPNRDRLPTSARGSSPKYGSALPS